MGFSEHDEGGTDSEVVVATSSGRLFHCVGSKKKYFLTVLAMLSSLPPCSCNQLPNEEVLKF